MATSRRSRQGGSEAAAGPAKSFLHRGGEGRKRMQKEMEESKRRRESMGSSGPFRFFVTPGTSKEMVILDDKPDVFNYEHTVQNPQTGKYNLNLTCAKEHDNCPACDESGDSVYVLYLSVLDLSEFKDKSGTTHEFSRKLMAVKPSQQKKFNRQYEKRQTLRGAIFECTRDGRKDAAIGNDIEFVEFMDLEELENDYVRTWEDRDGKEHTENCGEPYDYEKVIPPPDADRIAIAMNLRDYAPEGSTRQAKQLEEAEAEYDEDWEDDMKDQKWEEKEKETETEEEPEEEEEKPRRGSRRGRSGSKPAARSSRRSRKEEPEEEEEEKPRSRRTVKPRSTRSTNRRSRRD